MGTAGLQEEMAAARLDGPSIERQLAIIARLRDCLEAPEPSAVPHARVLSSEAQAALAEAAHAVLSAQFALQREVGLPVTFSSPSNACRSDEEFLRLPAFLV